MSTLRIEVVLRVDDLGAGRVWWRSVLRQLLAQAAADNRIVAARIDGQPVFDRKPPPSVDDLLKP